MKIIEDVEAELKKIGKKLNKLRKKTKFLDFWTRKITWPIMIFIFIILCVLIVLTARETEEEELLGLLGIFLMCIFIFSINSMIVLSGINTNSQAFKLILFESNLRGKPIQSLQGFDYLEHKIKENLKITRLLVWISLTFTFGYGIIVSVDWFSEILDFGEELQNSAIGVTLIILAIMMLFRIPKIDINRVLGLIEFHSTSTHTIFLDNYFAGLFYEHVDPITRLKWDDFVQVLDSLILKEFQDHIFSNEEGEIPIHFAIEKLLYISYLDFREIIDIKTVQKELEEVFDMHTTQYDYLSGADIGENTRYFSRDDIHHVFRESVEKYTPKILSTVDQIQVDILDNLEEISASELILKVNMEEVIDDRSIANLSIFLFNNNEKTKSFYLRIIAPNFQPNYLEIPITIEGCGNFRFPVSLDGKPIEMCDDSQGGDCVGVVSQMLKNGDSFWFSFKPKKTNKLQIISVLVFDDCKNLINGQTLSVKIQNKKHKQLIKEYCAATLFIIGGVFAFLNIIFLAIETALYYMDQYQTMGFLF